MSKPTRVRVQVPATSANLGVGFDCLGMALDLMASFSFEVADELEIYGCEERFATPDNLTWTSYVRACDELGEKARPVRLGIHSDIPLSGGLGSSAACAVAGVVAAQLLTGHDFDEDFTLRMATAIEGHPDNVAPAVLGGLVSSFLDEQGHPVCSRSDVSPEMSFVLVAPPYEVRTSEARRALPEDVPVSTAVWQMGRIVATVHALERGDAELLGKACHDLLHEPYRGELIPDYDALRQASLASGATAFFISGSGSSMIGACGSPEAAANVERALRELRPGFLVRQIGVRAEGVTISVG